MKESEEFTDVEKAEAIRRFEQKIAWKRKQADKVKKIKEQLAAAGIKFSI